MARIRELVKNFFVGFGKFIRDIVRGFAHERKQYHEEQRVKNQIEEERRQYYEKIEREGRAYGRGLAQGMADIREQERERRENERYWREYPPREYSQRVKKVFNSDFLTEDLQPKKRKKKRSIFGF